MIWHGNAYENKTFKNTAKGVREFIQSLPAAGCHFVIEATGNYSMRLSYLLDKTDIT